MIQLHAPSQRPTLAPRPQVRWMWSRGSGVTIMAAWVAPFFSPLWRTTSWTPVTDSNQGGLTTCAPTVSRQALEGPRGSQSLPHPHEPWWGRQPRVKTGQMSANGRASVAVPPAHGEPGSGFWGRGGCFPLLLLQTLIYWLMHSKAAHSEKLCWSPPWTKRYREWWKRWVLPEDSEDGIRAGESTSGLAAVSEAGLRGVGIY